MRNEIAYRFFEKLGYSPEWGEEEEIIVCEDNGESFFDENLVRARKKLREMGERGNLHSVDGFVWWW